LHVSKCEDGEKMTAIEASKEAGQLTRAEQKLYLGLDPLDAVDLPLVFLLLSPLGLGGTLQVLLLLLGQRLQVWHSLLAGLWSLNESDLTTRSVEDVVTVLGVCPTSACGVFVSAHIFFGLIDLLAEKRKVVLLRLGVVLTRRGRRRRKSSRAGIRSRNERLNRNSRDGRWIRQRRGLRCN